MIKNQHSLFKRVGGKQAIAELINDFYDRVVTDPELQPFFKNVSMAKLRRMQYEFFSAALDGPIKEFERPGTADLQFIRCWGGKMPPISPIHHRR